MAQTVKINGVIYNDVHQVKLPLASDTGKMAVFPDTSDGNATASDITKGKIAYVNGEKVVGDYSAPVLSLTEGVLSIA